MNLHLFDTESSCTCCLHVGVSGDTALIGHALLDVRMLVHQHHGYLFPGARPFLSGVRFTGHQMSVGRQLTRVAFHTAGVQLHLEGVTLPRSEWGAEDRCVCWGVFHNMAEIFHTPYKLWAGGLRKVDVIQ